MALKILEGDEFVCHICNQLMTTGESYTIDWQTNGKPKFYHLKCAGDLD